jgi:hypothetical protein
MKYYFYKLIPPRLDFTQTMTANEKSIMQDHVGYWTNNLKQEQAIAFGPVADPSGGYGVGIIKLPDDGNPFTLRDNDPAMKANIGFRTEIYPMPMLIAKT